MADCSELSQTIKDLVESVSSELNVKNFDDAVHEIRKDHPALTREIIADAVIEATEGKSRRTDALQKKLAGIIREPGIEKKTKAKVAKLNKLLSEGSKADTPAQRKIGSETIQSLRSTSANLTRWLKNNNPTAEKRLKSKLAELQEKIDSGDIDPQRRPALEFREPIKRLQEQVNEARKTILDARAISKVEKQIDTLSKHLSEGTLPESAKNDVFVSEQMRLAREIRDDLKKRVSKSEPAVKKRLEAQIADLTKRLKSGDIQPKERSEKVLQSKELERLEFERDKLQGEIRRQINNLKPRSKFEIFVQEPFNTARGIMTAFDFSAVFRQGGFIVAGHPIRAFRALVPMFKAFASEKQQAKIDKSIQDRPNAPLYKKAGLFIAPIDGSYKLSAREEIMQARLHDKIPGIAASNRAYTTFLNLLRADSFDIMAATLSKSGEVTLDEAKATAKYVNTATGRGTLGVAENAASVLNVAFFAPRYVASRFQLLGGVISTPVKAVAGENKRVHRQVVKEYARYLIGMSLVYALAALTLDDEEFEWNPTSSDFGKIKIGNTRLDPLSGIAQVTVLLSRLISGQIKSSDSGKITRIRGEDVGFGVGKASAVIGRFLRYKLSPMFATTVNLLDQEDAVGRPFGVEELPKNLLIPLSFKEILDTMTEQGMAKGTAMSTLAIFGMGVQTYGSSVHSMSTTELFEELDSITHKKTTRRTNSKTGERETRRKGDPHKGKGIRVDKIHKEINKRAF